MKAILVLYDSLNRRYLPCYNKNSEVSTPNFDRLAKQSVVFDKSFVGSMPCMPARREIHTGRYNFLHREWGPLEPFDDSMITMLREKNIYTHLISDHLHYWEEGGANYHTRYNTWEIVRGQEGDKWKASVKEPEIPPVVRVPCAHSGEKVTGNWRYDWVNREYIQKLEDFPQNKVFKLGSEFIEKNADSDDWFLQIETFDPHEPFYSAPEFDELYNAKEKLHYDWPRGEVTETEGEIEQVKNKYKSLVAMCDHHLGQILDLMDKHDLWKDTMLIVATDHGILLSEHGWWSKNLMPYYNEIANTPLFVWDPRYKQQNTHNDRLVQMIDFAPTLLNYFNIKPTKDMLGGDIGEVISKNKIIHESVLFGVFSGHVNITDGRYCYMRAAEEDRKECVYNYTLMPSHMTKPFSVDEIKKSEFVDGFSFTKGCKLLRIPSKDKYKVAHFGTMLFDLEKDPLQHDLVKNSELEQILIGKLKNLMEANEAPEEQYFRLGIEG